MQEKNKISIYTRCARLDPSSYYRISQYAAHIPGAVVHSIYPAWVFVRVHAPGRKAWLRKAMLPFLYIYMVCRATRLLLADLLLHRPVKIQIERGIVPRYTPPMVMWLLKRLAARAEIVWDFDDDVMYSGEISPQEYKLYVKRAQTIVTTSEYLKLKLPEAAQKRVHLLPTTDGDVYRCRTAETERSRRLRFSEEVEIVWIGTAGNLKHLECIAQAVDEAATRMDKRLKLTVVCNKPLDVTFEKALLCNVKWSRKRAIQSLLQSHIGIMPLEEDTYALGKGAFKLIQYLSAGIPVVATAVGFNKKVVRQDFGVLLPDNNLSTWTDTIVQLAQDEALWASKSAQALKEWEKRYHFEEYLAFWQRILL